VIFKNVRICWQLCLVEFIKLIHLEWTVISDDRSFPSSTNDLHVLHSSHLSLHYGDQPQFMDGSWSGPININGSLLCPYIHPRAILSVQGDAVKYSDNLTPLMKTSSRAVGLVITEWISKLLHTTISRSTASITDTILGIIHLPVSCSKQQFGGGILSRSSGGIYTIRVVTHVRKEITCT
jgi:hypothetical protein